MDAAYLEVLKTRLEGVLGNLLWYQIWRLVTMPVQGGWNLNGPWVQTLGSLMVQTKQFYDSVILSFCD